MLAAMIGFFSIQLSHAALYVMKYGVIHEPQTVRSWRLLRDRLKDGLVITNLFLLLLTLYTDKSKKRLLSTLALTLLKELLVY